MRHFERHVFLACLFSCYMSNEMKLEDRFFPIIEKIPIGKYLKGECTGYTFWRTLLDLVHESLPSVGYDLIAEACAAYLGMDVGSKQHYQFLNLAFIIDESQTMPAYKGYMSKERPTKSPDAVAGVHYDFQPVKETIELIEQVVNRDNLPPSAAYCIGNALKYILRAGKKTPDWKEDISKAENYLHRAIHGEWAVKK